MEGTRDSIRALNDALENWRARMASGEPGAARHAGTAFEELCAAYLKHDPVQSGHYHNVRTYAEWAESKGEPKSDKGIDLVAELKREPGRLAAIQCKFRADTGTVAKSEIDSFLAASSRLEFGRRVLIDTTARMWSSHAEDELRRLTPPAVRIGIHDLRNSSIRWDDYLKDESEFAFSDKKQPRPHQKSAIKAVETGLEEQGSRGKLLMACGTGKTLTSLRIAERLAGPGGWVLYLVPSLALMAQTVREWCTDAETPIRAFAVCSDAQVGRQRRTSEDKIDMDALDLAFPATTRAEELFKRAEAAADDSLTVIFATYQSSKVVQQAQEFGMPRFDLAIADEAHRTAGAIVEGEEHSDFVRIHDEECIRAKRRLYMTATPKVYAASARRRAGELETALCSMDDEQIFGPVLYELGFGAAVEQDLLSDFRVVILTVPTEAAARLLHGDLTNHKITIDDAAKLIGCWRALAKVDAERAGFPETEYAPMQRAIAFCNTIKSSKQIEELLGSIAKQYQSDSGLAAHPVEAQHIDGTFRAVSRAEKLDWLALAESGECRVLTNARCLAEGVDVPALDAVLFMHPRKSQLEVVQAVGRVMRKAEGKRMGYVVLPVVVAEGREEPEQILDRNEAFKSVWQTLNALRSHDERFDAMIQRMVGGDPGDRISIITLRDWNPPSDAREDGPGIGRGSASEPDSEQAQAVQMEFEFEGLPEAIRAKIVEKCGNRVYWQEWAGDVAHIAQAHIQRIREMARADEAAKELFGNFVIELRQSLNTAITEDEAIEMLAQHVVTKPVFEALFEDDEFADRNPVGKGMQLMLDVLKPSGIDVEAESLENFYASVRRRAEGAQTAEARQKLVTELYDNFFRKAFPDHADRLGIAYTPPEIVDFILRSADEACREAFGEGLGAPGVHIIDPFAGTGAFLVRLLELGLIPKADLERKYREELHANEVMLLPYYITAKGIESAFRKAAGNSDWLPFEGICLTDTFAGAEETDLIREIMPANSDRIATQQKLDLQVIISNPPWRAQQGSSADFNPNVNYPVLRNRIESTYAARSRATNKNSLYDQYKMAIRWASDRIGERGIIAIVTNASWVDGNADSGLRACLAEEFTKIDIVNLRGNTRTSGDRSRREGGQVFGSGSRAPVAVTILTKNPSVPHGGGGIDNENFIRYYEVSDGLNREEKLNFLKDTKSISGIIGWQEIIPDESYDWIEKRDPRFANFIPIGTKEAKAGKDGSVIFRKFSGGVKTNRDAYLYNFDQDACATNAERAIECYNRALDEWRTQQADGITFKDCRNGIAKAHSHHLRWDRELENSLKRCKAIKFNTRLLSKVQYRPFVSVSAYMEWGMISRKYLQDQFFPLDGRENIAIYVPGLDSTRDFSALATDTLPDLHLISGGQCFPRWTYRISPSQWDSSRSDDLGLSQHDDYQDNITDEALSEFQGHYRNDTISKDSIFAYIYGVLHAPDYREQFKNNFSRELPRVPFAADFEAFSEAGQRLFDLHLRYDDGPEWPLETDSSESISDSQLFKITNRQMKYLDKARTSLRVNDQLVLRGIPPEAHEYVVNGRTPLEWFIDRYRVTTDKRSGILNDPNKSFTHPRDLLSAFQCIVYLSVETAKIINGLPPSLED